MSRFCNVYVCITAIPSLCHVIASYMIVSRRFYVMVLCRAVLSPLRSCVTPFIRYGSVSRYIATPRLFVTLLICYGSVYAVLPPPCLCHAVDTLLLCVTLCCHLHVCVTPLIRYCYVSRCAATSMFVSRRWYVIVMCHAMLPPPCLCHAVDTLLLCVTLCCHLHVCVTPLIRYCYVSRCAATSMFMSRRWYVIVMCHAVLPPPCLCHAVDTLSFSVTLCCHLKGMCPAASPLCATP